MHGFFKAPFNITELNDERQLEARWVTRYYHGIDWSYGDMTYHCIKQQIRDLISDCETLYVKGEEKKLLLQNIEPNIKIVDINSINCDSIKQLKKLSANNKKCLYHTKGKISHTPLIKKSGE